MIINSSFIKRADANQSVPLNSSHGKLDQASLYEVMDSSLVENLLAQHQQS